ncbi:MAG: hypothetical protein AUK55_13435 [Syntrophobacteraceae bacterium CG2_30_61_12]|nr:MAG: hypothetical protein AUK55_13435 [Syntrophobacteraceae bacterium CG2_30_61_12]
MKFGHGRLDSRLKIAGMTVAAVTQSKVFPKHASPSRPPASQLALVPKLQIGYRFRMADGGGGNGAGVRLGNQDPREPA